MRTKNDFYEIVVKDETICRIFMCIAKVEDSDRPRQAIGDEPYVRIDQLLSSLNGTIEKDEILNNLDFIIKLGLITQMYLEVSNQYYTKEDWHSNCFDNFDEGKDENRICYVNKHRPQGYEKLYRLLWLFY
jgi:hypothetical protein